MLKSLEFRIYDKTLRFNKNTIDTFVLDMFLIFLNTQKNINELKLDDNIKVQFELKKRFNKKVKKLCFGIDDKNKYDTFLKSLDKILCYGITQTDMLEYVKNNK